MQKKAVKFNELFDKIMQVDFTYAEELFWELTSYEQQEFIDQLVYDTESMIIYFLYSI